MRASHPKPVPADSATFQLPLIATPPATGFTQPTTDFVEAGIDFNRVIYEHPSATFIMKVAVRTVRSESHKGIKAAHVAERPKRNCLSDGGRNSHPSSEWKNSNTPRVATGHQSLKRGATGSGGKPRPAQPLAGRHG